MTRQTVMALSFCAALVWPGVAMASDTAQAPSDKEIYAQAEALRLGTDQEVDAAAAFELMQGLAEAGYDRAQAKLGYYHLKGVGTEADVTAAAHWYQQAIEGGRDSARTSYAKLLMSQGETAQSLAQLDAAVAAGVANAKPLRAAYHYQGKFGAASDREQGKRALTQLAKDGDVGSIGVVLAAVAAGEDFDVAPAELEAELLDVARTDAGKAGGKAAEVLLVLWEGQKDATELRQEMLEHESLRSKVWAQQSLLLAYEKDSPRGFRKSAAEIVANTDEANRARAFYLVSRLDKNAYVHVLQEVLKEQGYYRGAVSGWLTRGTIRALLSFCADNGIQSECELGPLRSKVIKQVTAELVAAGA